MPKVGTKHYPYTEKGKAAAKKAAARTGMPMKMPKGMPPKGMPMKGGMSSAMKGMKKK